MIPLDYPFSFNVIESAGRDFRRLVLSLLLLSLARYVTEMDTMKRSLCVLSGSLLVCVALAAPAPDPMKAWDNPVDPDQDCKIRRDSGVLSIEMPGTEHDYDPLRKRLNAPRILREIEGEFDLQVRMRIVCPRSAQSSVKGHPACVSAGFLMIFPDTYPYSPVCRRLDYGVVQQRIGIDDFPFKASLPYPQIEKESRKGIGEDGCVLWRDWVFGARVSENGEITIDRDRLKQSSLDILDRGCRDWPMPKKIDCVYLRMEQGDKYISFFMSPDGEKWTRVVVCAPALPAKSKVCLAAYTTSSEPSKVRFDQIKFWRGKNEKR